MIRKKSPAKPLNAEKKSRRPLDYLKLFFISITLIAWTLFSIFLAEFCVGYLLLAILGAEKMAEPVWTTVYSAVTYSFALILIVVIPPLIRLVFNRKNQPTSQPPTKMRDLFEIKILGLHGWPTWSDIGLALVGYAVYLLLAMILVNIFANFPWFNASEAQNVGFSMTVTGWDRIVAFITLVILAPMAEEMIFRGWLYGKLREVLAERTAKWTGIILSSLLTSLAFAIIHGQWNVGVNVFAMSLVLCAFREITGTIHAGILLHILKNGIAFYILYIAGTSGLG